jgi:hypothetical protein
VPAGGIHDEIGRHALAGEPHSNDAMAVGVRVERLDARALSDRHGMVGEQSAAKMGQVADCGEVSCATRYARSQGKRRN